MATVRFGILGPLLLERDGEAIAVGRVKQRALLALFVTEAGRTVSVDRIIDELWGDEPPAKATASLQAYVSNLRRLLDPDRVRAVLVTEPPGYRLAADVEQVDSARFEALAAAARDHLRAGAPTDALDAANAALELWRGPALVEFRDDGFAEAAVARLEELRDACEEDRAAAMLDLGLHVTAVAELEAAVRRQPLRERRWALLVTALYRAGRSADALDRVRRLRSILREELGLDPSPEMRSLEHAVLNHDESVLARSVPVVTVSEPITTTEGPTTTTQEPESSALLERANVLDEIERAFADAAGGRTRVVVVEGEAGMGKTAIAEEAAARARRHGCVVAWGSCHEDGDAPALWPWTQILRVLGVGTLPRGGNTDAFAVLDLHATALIEAARRGPVACLVEDVHWADPSTLRMLAFLAVELRDVPVLLIVTARPDEQRDAVAPAVAALLRHPGSIHLPLQPLSADAARELAVAVGGDRLGDADIVHLHERTGGNPLFVTELARLLAAEGSAAGVPAGVREVIARRSRRLPEEANALLSLAAVSGSDVDLGLMASASGVDADRVTDLLDAALAIGLLRTGGAPGQLSFAHSLVRETFLTSLSGLHRRRLHARLAATFAGRADRGASTLYEWAHHAVEGVPFVSAAEARAAAEAAAMHAETNLAFDTAGQWWRAALQVHDGSADLAVDTATRGRLLLALAGSSSREGADDDAQQLIIDALAVAEERGDATLAVDAARSLGETGGAWLWVKVGADPRPLLARFERSLASIAPTDDAARATILGTMAVGNTNGVDPDRAVTLSAQAVEAARRLADRVVLGRALAARWRSLWRPGFAEEMLEVAVELDEVAGTTPGAGFDLEAATCLHVAHLTLADLPAAEAALDRALGFARERRLIQFEAQLLPNLATIRLLKGDVAGGRQVFEEAVNRWERVQFPLEGAQRALLLWMFGKETGDLADAADALDTYLGPHFSFWAAVAAQCRGDDAAARSSLDEEGLGVVQPIFDGTASAAQEAEVAADLGMVDIAARAATSLAPHAGELAAIGTAGVYGPVAIGLGRAFATVGQVDAAAQAFRTALEVADRNGMRTSSIWARLRLSELLPDRADAVRIAGEAAHEAATLGLLVAARAGEELCAWHAGRPS